MPFFFAKIVHFHKRDVISYKTSSLPFLPFCLWSLVLQASFGIFYCQNQKKLVAFSGWHIICKKAVEQKKHQKKLKNKKK